MPLAGPCVEGDSHACVDAGDESGRRNDLATAQRYYEAACNRYTGSVADTATLYVTAVRTKKASFEFLMRHVRQPEELEAQLGLEAGSTATQRAEDDLDAAQKTIQEVGSRLNACMDLASYVEKDHPSRALALYDAACEMQAVLEPDGETNLVRINTESGCEMGRADRAASRQFRAQFAAQMTAALTNAAASVGQSVASSNAGPRVVSSAASAASGSCADGGQSCKSDGAVVDWKQRCSGGMQAACYCAAAATHQCFLAHGCYAEAGATRADGSPTTVRKATLQSGVSTNAARASELGTSCGSR